MNKNRSLVVLAAGGALLLGLTQAASAASPPSPQLLGEIGALGKFCGTLQAGGDAASEKFLRTLRQQLAAGAQSQAEFEQAYGKMHDALAKLDLSKARTLCALPRAAGHDNPRR
jgi:hypothetical protein